jgi:hypothetical protein
MADSSPKAADASEKLSWKLFVMVAAGAAAFIAAALILAP